MRMDTISRITPPATSRERSDRRITRKKASPSSMNASSTAKAIETSRTATQRRRDVGTLRMIGMNTGRLPRGSSTRSSKTKAEKKLWSMSRILPAVVSVPWRRATTTTPTANEGSFTAQDRASPCSERCKFHAAPQ